MGFGKVESDASWFLMEKFCNDGVFKELDCDDDNSEDKSDSSDDLSEVEIIESESDA